MGIALEIGGVEPEAFEEGRRARTALGGFADAVNDERLGHDAADREARVERAEGILEDELDLAPEGLERPLRECGELDPAQAHAAAVGAVEQGRGARERGLAAAALADERQGLARKDREAHPDECRQAAPAACGKMLREAVDGEEGFRHRAALKQATRCRGPTSASAGSAARQVGSASGQRSEKRQPGGRAKGEGIWPGIPAGAPPAPIRGTLAMSAWL